LVFPVPKQKSHSGAKKRIRRTGSGRFACKRRGRSHLLQQKSRRQKRLPRTLVPLGSNQQNLRSLLPYL
ncbi:MAG: 50S ribosomal protein L35, partial [Candidatus Peribacteraceae bacterium]|nr:50S ribosomal protein L35 [Candidatus Peribacteraceae bacterium]